MLMAGAWTKLKTQYSSDTFFSEMVSVILGISYHTGARFSGKLGFNKSLDWQLRLAVERTTLLQQLHSPIAIEQTLAPHAQDGSVHIKGIWAPFLENN